MVSEEGDGLRDHLKKPHAPQVVAIWTLLNCAGMSDVQELQNHLVELKTGEGKSIVLGIAAIVLALFECDVSCVCYSSYLSDRDFSDFESMFHDFGVADRVHYGTLQNLCERMLNEEGSVRDLTIDAFRGNVSVQSRSRAGVNESSSGSSKLVKVLLVDEVDVFFKKDFFGQTHRLGTRVNDPATKDLMQFIWKNRTSLNASELLSSRQAEKCLETCTRDLRPIFERLIKNMLTDAQKVGRGEGMCYTVCDGKIGYKYLDGLSFDTSYGSETSFAYIKEHEQGNVNQSTMDMNIGISLRCGMLSFAELPVSFDFILGVTGTLKGLSTGEVNVLRTVYDVQNSTYIPSAYGKNRLSFKEDNDKGENTIFATTTVVYCH